MRCCASLLPADLQGSHFLLGLLRLAHILDAMKHESQPLGDGAWGRCLVTIPIDSYLYPTVEVLALSHKWSPTPKMVHPVYLIPIVLMIPLPIQALFRLFTHVTPLLQLFLLRFPHLFAQLLLLSEFLLQLLQLLLCFLHSWFLPLP